MGPARIPISGWTPFVRYEFPIENGLHTVILYFSENCSACVNTNLAGTGPSGTARIVDLEVEGWRTNNYSPAAAAVPPVLSRGGSEPDDALRRTKTNRAIAHPFTGATLHVP